MNPEPSTFQRLLRRGGPLLAALAIGGGAGAGVYALTSGGNNDNAAATNATASTPTAIVPSRPAATTTTTSSLTQLYKDDAPGVVDITVDSTSSSGQGNFGNPFGNPGGGSQQTQAEGTGFEIDSKGDILTAQHVVAGASSISVHFQNGTSAKATLVGSDKTTDTAVIHVDVPASELHPLALGDSSSVQPGDEVVAIGSPFGLTETMTSGIVSAIDRTITAPNNYAISGAIQTDAPINHGNSGGPLLTTDGQVVGVNAQIESDSGGNDGVGFALAIDPVKSVVNTIISGGVVQHAYLGIHVGDAASGGAKIASVQSGSPADTAGLQAGDVITALDGKPITGADDLTAAVAAHQPKDKVTLTITRNGKTMSVDVTLGVRPS